MRAVVRGHPSYPAGLLDLDDAPATVFLRGSELPPPARAVAIVGSRAASPYGRDVAARLSADLARIGFVVVSGLARGVDAAAHRAALDVGGTTVAVLPGGLDAVAPRHHLALAEEIAARGALMTEHPRGAPSHGGSFVTRNRLIAALAGATVVVEAAVRSGALSTAAAARRLGRGLLAVPGDVDRETARGCHRLLRQGAELCEGASDVLRVLDRGAPPRRARAGPVVAGANAVAAGGGAEATPSARLRAALRREPRSLETLAETAGLAVPDALAGLLGLQWAGAARAFPGQRWARGGD